MNGHTVCSDAAQIVSISWVNYIVRLQVTVDEQTLIAFAVMKV